MITCEHPGCVCGGVLHPLCDARPSLLSPIHAFRRAQAAAGREPASDYRRAVERLAETATRYQRSIRLARARRAAGYRPGPVSTNRRRSRRQSRAWARWRRRGYPPITANVYTMGPALLHFSEEALGL